jgi:hypothetical protein
MFYKKKGIKRLIHSQIKIFCSYWIFLLIKDGFNPTKLISIKETINKILMKP